jgi:ABC-2 type transport system ATP-binding protein
MSSLTADAPPLLPPVPASAQTVVAVDGVSVRYRMPRERITSIKDFAIRKLKGQIAYDEFWALKDVSLTIRKGETVGIIGSNGAGKSTLLKLVARVQRPTGGRVRVKGRVAPLLELGAAFDYELTGRENILLYGTVLGFSTADVQRRLDRIVAFAGIGEFIDLPLRAYSTGMVARLGFAIATDVQPDVLLVDEVLAVGDAEFQQRSTERMQELRRHGDAILMVSHNLESIRRLCHRAVWLDHGQVRAIGPADAVVTAYKRPALPEPR